ncbi:MAG: hypothetical protein Kow0031_12010 [Anaerolineae bacterium]
MKRKDAHPFVGAIIPSHTLPLNLALRPHDLIGADLFKARLTVADPAGANLTNERLPGPGRRGANLRGVLLDNAALPGASLASADMGTG